MKYSMFGIMIVSLLAAPIAAQEEEKKLELTDLNDRFSYALGVNIGRNFKMQGMDCDLDIFLKGIKDALADTSQLSDEEMEKAIQEYSEILRKTVAEKAKASGLAFLEEKKKEDGVVALESGLCYKVLTDGPGEKPKDTDTVKVHYEGRLIDGTIFDSSYERGQPAKFPLKGVIKGWTEGLQHMPVGAVWEFYIPSHLAYGERGAPPKIPPHSTLVFKVELLSIEKSR